MSNEINAVIDNLCETLGTTFERLVPELAKAEIAKAMTMVLMCLVSAAVTVLFFKWAEKKSKQSKYTFIGYLENCCFVPLAFIVCIDVFTFIGMICYLPELVMWIASPTGSTVRYILNAIGG